MATRTSVPVLLLTGFLGSGKTSLLARWLKAPEFAGAIVIVNELGEVGIDDRLVEASSDAPLLLDNGCACCAAGEDLTATLERLFWDRLHRKIPKFSWVLIETTGVADPAPILDRMARHQLVSERYHVEGVVTTFDAKRGPEQLARHPECASQLANARAVVITKTDIASNTELDAARAAVKAAAPHAQILTSSRADLSAAAVVAALAHATHVCDAHCHHDHAHDHAHGDHVHAAHSEGVTTAFAPLHYSIDGLALEAALNRVMADYGAALLRLKGLVRLAPDDEWRVVQAAADTGVDFSARPRADADTKAGMTIIAQGTPAQTIADAILARLARAPQAVA